MRNKKDLKKQKGAALILSLMFLIMFSLLGAALISMASMETHIGDDYKINSQVLYLTEAGIDQARESLRASPNTMTQILTTAAGMDGVLSTSTDLATLASADQAWVNNATLTDLTGRSQGQYHVFLRNDAADGPTSVTDTNDVISLLAIGRFRNAIKTVEVEVRRGAIPDFPAALTLDGPIGYFNESNSAIFDIDGNDSAMPPVSQKTAVGVIDSAGDTTVTTAIQGPPDRSANYTGAGGVPSVDNVSGTLGQELLTPAGLESVVADIASYATTTYNPGYPGSVALGNVGTAANSEIVVVNGDCVFGPATGYGILVVRGNLTFNGNFTWHGVIYVIGQGHMEWNGGAQGEISGAMLIAASRGLPRTSTNPVGPLLGTRGPVYADFNGGGGNGIHYHSQDMRNANHGLPFRRMSYRLF